jgi:hypothetical protein
MKYLAVLALALALVGCEGGSDASGKQDKAERAGDAQIASLSPKDTAEPPTAAKTDAQQGPKAKSIQFGLYKATREGRITTSAEANTGKVVRSPVLEQVKMTDRVPLVKDTYFGYQYRIWNLPPEVLAKPVMELRKVLIHPEMTLPDGSTTTGWDKPHRGKVKTGQVIEFDGYAFNEDYELVEGDWIFQIWYGDQKLVERKFVTYWPEEDQTEQQEQAETEAPGGT